MEKSFKEIVQSMTAKEIIMAMVEALKDPYYKIDMNTYGQAREIDSEGDTKLICFGCAATNTISKISGIIFTPDTINWEERVFAVTGKSAQNKNYTYTEEGNFLDKFESAIDRLRSFEIDEYNKFANLIDIANIEYKTSIDNIRKLNDYYNQKDLDAYIELANQQ